MQRKIAARSTARIRFICLKFCNGHILPGWQLLIKLPKGIPMRHADTMVACCVGIVMNRPTTTWTDAATRRAELVFSIDQVIYVYGDTGVAWHLGEGAISYAVTNKP
jgi:hypothetical protein